MTVPFISFLSHFSVLSNHVMRRSLKLLTSPLTKLQTYATNTCCIQCEGRYQLYKQKTKNSIIPLSGRRYSRNPDILAAGESSPKSGSPSKRPWRVYLHNCCGDPLPPTPSTPSVMKIHDPQYPGPSASLLETEETPEKNRKGSWYAWTSSWRR